MVFVVSVVFVAPRNTGSSSIRRGLFSECHLVVFVVLVVSSVKNKQPPS